MRKIPLLLVDDVVNNICVALNVNKHYCKNHYYFLYFFSLWASTPIPMQPTLTFPFSRDLCIVFEIFVENFYLKFLLFLFEIFVENKVKQGNRLAYKRSKFLEIVIDIQSF